MGRLATGIFVDTGGSAQIENNTITTDTSYNITGTQSGTGINVDNGGKAFIRNNVISQYQKTGVRINGLGTVGILIGNNIVGVGPTDTIPQNGIQISRRASALVEENTVSENLYTGDTWFSCGILLTISPSPVTVQRNISSNNDTGIALGIEVTDALVQENTFSYNTNYGIWVYSTSINNKFINDTSQNNRILDVTDSSSGTGTGDTGNTYLCEICITDNVDGDICRPSQ